MYAFFLLVLIGSRIMLRKKNLLLGLSLVLSLFQSTVALAELKVGSNAPSFSAPAALAGQTYQFVLAEALKKGPVVVYFYPKAFTTGCTIEAQLFAEATDKFAALKATVIGVSADDVDTLKKFSQGPCGGKFAVAADLDRSIIKAYDAGMMIKPDMASRISSVVTPDSKVLFVHSGMNPDQHVSNTLAALQAWQAKR
jgi:alkyl hydroperoxide reductase subunit AhpC